MHASEFVKRWAASTGSERQVAQTHFRDLCELLGEPYPHQHPANDATYCYEFGIEKSGGGDGFADVWRDQHFGWEYKGKHANLQKAYKQLVDYHENLNSPPLLVVCDIDRYEIHTRWTNQESWIWKFRNEDITNDEPVVVEGSGGASIQNAPQLTAIRVLKALWEDPDRLRPNSTTEQITKQAAALFDGIAETLRKYKVDDMRIARFISRVMFCMFATDVGLLPPETFSALLKNHAANANLFQAQLSALFREMHDGGHFGAFEVRHFNGELFADDDVPEWMTSQEILNLGKLNALNWADVEPAIFGTLFERVLDKTQQRAKLGAHYTSREDIELLVEPVLMWRFRRQWEAIKAKAESLPAGTTLDKHSEVEKLVTPLLDDLASVRVLDPACGSGNFLYVSLALLKALEKEVLAFAGMFGVDLEPRVHPKQLYGIEINPYAHELASIVIWIGYLQWKHRNALPLDDDDPILQKLDQIELKDAILDMTDFTNPTEAEWPIVDVVVGNPPFLGVRKMRKELGDEYVERLFAIFSERVQPTADLCVYWHEKARALIEAGSLQRAGLLATQAIRGVSSRKTLSRVIETGGIFFGQSNRPWILEGAAVRVSMVAQDDGSESHRELDGIVVSAIDADLTPASDLLTASRLTENQDLCFQGPVKVGPFDIEAPIAARLLASPNPDGRSNSLVVRPWVNGDDITGRPSGKFIIDFADLPEEQAALYEAPFAYVKRYVYPVRSKNRRARRAKYWWQHGETVPALRREVQGLSRILVTPRVAKHRVFAWVSSETLPDSRVYVFAREDDYFFGMLQSRSHETWALRKTSSHGKGNDPTYNNSTCFDTFPFPWPPGHEPVDDPKMEAVAAAAKRLVVLREGWLNPKPVGGLELPEAELKKRTLTSLYNECPTWLANAHHALDEAVFGAYGWPANLTDEEILERLLALNLERSQAST